VAHELRTPLTILKGTVEAIADGVVENREEGLENVRLEVEKLIRLVEGIEDITKAEASFFGQRELTEVSLPGLLRAVAAKFSPLAAEKGISLRIGSEQDLNVMTDEEKLDRIIQNVLSNAIRHTVAGGIWIDYSSGRDFFKIEVRDTGSGIREEDIPLLFKRFYKGEDSQGIGLGLAIVKELVDVMGGSIQVGSKVGAGSVFTLRFPLIKP
jgi:signal transduction histidine kinase